MKTFGITSNMKLNKEKSMNCSIFTTLLLLGVMGLLFTIGGGDSIAHQKFGTFLDKYMGVANYSNSVPRNDGEHCGCLSNTYGTYGYIFQCVEYVNRFYVQAFSHRNMRGTGSGKDYFNSASTPDYPLNQYSNGCPVLPQAGDILCFDAWEGKPSNPDGHVAIVRDVTMNGDNGTVTVIQQNVLCDYGDGGYNYPIRAERGGYRVYRDAAATDGISCQGWLRKNANGGPSTTKVTVDDGELGFTLLERGCTKDVTPDPISDDKDGAGYVTYYDRDIYYYRIPSSTSSGQVASWMSNSLSPGYWNIQVYIPNAHGTVTDACYKVYQGNDSEEEEWELLYTRSVNQNNILGMWTDLTLVTSMDWNQFFKVELSYPSGHAGEEIAIDAVRWIKQSPQYELVMTIPNPILHDDYSEFGSSVAVVGNKILVGNPRRGMAPGEVYLFDGSTVSLKIHSPSGTIDKFGYSVAAMGENFLVCAPWDNEKGVETGAVYLYDQSGNLLHKFYSPNPTPRGGGWGGSFGNSVAVTLDGHIVVGAPYDEIPPAECMPGKVYIFSPTGELIRTIASQPLIMGEFGWSVAALGNDIIVAERNSPLGSGKVYLFSQTGQLRQTFQSPRQPPVRWDFFGNSVAAVGDNILVGELADAGAAYLFNAETGGIGTGTPIHTFLNPTSESDLFGNVVAAMGNNVIVGAPNKGSGSVCNSGAVYIFNGTTGDLSQIILNPTPGANEGFGSSVAATGNILIIGAPGAVNRGLGDNGAVYVYSFIGSQPAPSIFAQGKTSKADVLANQRRLPVNFATEIPRKTELLQNYPNPFNPETWIPFRLAADAFVTLTIYDVKGNVVRNLEIGQKPAAVYVTKEKAIYWDGRNNAGERVASGIYFYRLAANDFTAMRKMLIFK
jgi:surface antigen